MKIVKYRFRTHCWTKRQILQVKVKWRGPSFPGFTICDQVEWRDANREEADDFVNQHQFSKPGAS